MIPKESKLTRFELPLISLKTSSEQLQRFASDRWPSDARKFVAKDIIQNGKELLARYNINWDLVLSNIRVMQVNTLRVGVDAIAVNGARMIGGLAVVMNSPMYAPPIVYLSGGLLVNKLVNNVRNSEEFEDFKEKMEHSSVFYGQNTLLPPADLHMEILNFLLRIKDRTNNWHFIKRLASLLKEGRVEDAHTWCGHFFVYTNFCPQSLDDYFCSPR